MLWHLVHFVATFALGLGLGIYLTPVIRRGAVRFGVWDAPDNGLKDHPEPVPYLGGIAVYLAFLLTLALVFEFRAALLGLLLGGTMMAMLGLFDDLRVLSPGLKLFGQLLVALVLLKSDISIQLIAIPVWVALLASVLWIVAITNAVNIVDVSDGLAAGVAAIASGGLFVTALLGGDRLIATTTLALMGSTLGFLLFNRAPARIYLGDAGSLFLGVMLAALSMIGAYTTHNEIAALAPVFILIVPILDTALVSVARLRRHRAPWRGSHDHLAHRLAARGWSPRGIAWFGYGLGLGGSGIGIALILASFTVAAALAGGGAAIYGAVWLWLLLQDPARAVNSASTSLGAEPVSRA